MKSRIRDWPTVECASNIQDRYYGTSIIGWTTTLHPCEYYYYVLRMSSVSNQRRPQLIFYTVSIISLTFIDDQERRLELEGEGSVTAVETASADDVWA